jgi:phospholipid-translocating ATPase
MVFRKCTIGGNAYRGDIGSSLDEPMSIVEVPIDPAASGDSSADTRVHDELETKMSTHAALEKFTDLALQLDISNAFRSQNTASDFSTTLIIGFFTVLSLCHSVIAAKDPVTGKVEYRAQSPDEAALVKAAAEMGFEFLGKDKDILSLKTPGSAEIEKYELLDILEFTSARKRMSVVLRKQDNSLLLLTKGADNVIFERLQPGADEMKRETENHLSEFANSGLRTLTLAYKTISGSSKFLIIFFKSLFSDIWQLADEYAIWSERYREATIAQDDREGRIEAVSSELEQNLCLLGATAIEDRLQDGVPETIKDLKTAGIKIWVATGDKLETAIGMSDFIFSPVSSRNSILYNLFSHWA